MKNNNSVYFRILLAAVSVEGFEQEKIDIDRLFEDGDTDPCELLRYADAHCIKPQLAKLAEHIKPGLLPQAFLEKINSEYRKNLYDQLGYTAEFYRINDLLNSEGIVAVPFKGFSLAYEVYENVGDREAGDIDLFVNENDLERIEALMSETGYEVEDTFYPYTLKEIKRKFGEYNFNRYEDDKCIFHFEYHWKAGITVHGLDITLSDLQQQIIAGTVPGTHAFTPSAHLLLAVMHHGGKDPLIKLKHVYDIARILNSGTALDWQWIILTAGKFHVEDLLYISVRQASELTGVKIPVDIREQTCRKKIIRLTRNRIRYMALQPGKWNTLWFVTNDWLFRLRSRNGFRVRCGLLYFYFRKVLMPSVVPKRWHYLFLEKNRKKPAVI